MRDSQLLEIKRLDSLRHPVLATHAKLDENVRKELIDAIRLLEGTKTKLRELLAR